MAVATRPGAHRPSSGPARPESRDRAFRRDIQGLRALAVGMVVAYHLYPSAVPGGFAGVDVFFVISGFLITGHLYAGWRRTGHVRLLDFWGRRARRLLPAAAVVLGVTWLLARVWLPATELPATVQQIRASALYFQNWVLAHDAVDYLTASAPPSPVQHFWSLSVEEQFYLGWPILFLVAGLLARRHLRAGRLAVAGLAAAVLAASLAYSAYYTAQDPPAAYFVTTTRIWELALGGLLAMLPARWWQPLSRQGWLGWVGLAMVIGSAFRLSGSSAFPGTVALWPVGGAALLILAGSAEAVRGPAVLTARRPLVFIGDVSYSLYLWHWPVIVLWKAYSGGPIGALDGPAIVVLSVALAWATTKLVEDRVRRAPWVTARPWHSLATALTVLVPVGLVALYSPPPPYHRQLDAGHPGAAALISGSSSSPSASPSSSQVPPRPTPEQAPKDFVGGAGGQCQTPIVSTKPRSCVFGTTTGYRLTVALVGDSVVDQWRGTLIGLARKHKWRIITELHGECPWTTTMTAQLRTSSPYVKCHEWGRLALDALLTKDRPDVVITSARPVLGTPSHPKPDATSYAAIAAGMDDYWRRLAAHGTRIVAIAESPEPHRNVPACLTRPGATAESCATPTSRAILRHTPIERAVAGAPGIASLVNMNDLICGVDTCEPFVGNVTVYRDTHHLTETYAETLRPYLERRLLATHAFDRPHWH